MTNQISVPSPMIGRRNFLLGVSALASATALASCSSSTGGGGGGGAATDPAALDALLPNYVPVQYAEPAFPSVNGSPLIYTEYPPLPLASSVPETPGAGSRITTMQPVYGAVPPSLPDNDYNAMMNEHLGADLIIGSADAGTYAEKLAAVLASPKDVADWTVIPVEMQPPRFEEAVEACFEDLTPYLSADNIEKYPNLAGIQTDTWRFCFFNGKLMSIPYPQVNVSGFMLSRQDLMDELGLEAPTNAEELVEFAKAATDPGANRWALDDIWDQLGNIFKVPPMWRIDGGNLVHRYETDEYAAALEYNADLYAAGVVHPDAMVGSGDNLVRFSAGNIVMFAAGWGGWAQTLRQVGDSIPGYNPQAVAPFAADGGTPVIWQAPSVSMNNFFKKGTEPAKIEEMLRIANFCAAPFGTTELEMIRSGFEGVHFERADDGAPLVNEKFNLEYGGGYLFLCSCERVITEVSLPGFGEAIGTWTTDAVQYLEQPAFFGQNIQTPAHLSGLDQQMTDFEADVFNGRKSVGDLDAAVESWRAAGGEELREHYAQYLDA